MGRLGIVVVGLVVALVLGFGLGWVAFGSDDDPQGADLACAAAEDLPAEVADGPVPKDQMQERGALYSRIAGVGLLAQAAGQDGPAPDDLDELGEAGRQLSSVVQRASLEDYPGARDDLLTACDDR